MTNKELGEFISSEEFQETSTDLVNHTESIIGAGADIVTSFFFGIPCYPLLKPFIDGLDDWRSRVELKQLAYFLKEFENLSQSERSDFSLLIQGNEEDFTERLFYYISMLNDKRKSAICGRIGVAFARKKIPEKYFLRIITKITRIDYYVFLELLELHKIAFRGKDRLVPLDLNKLPFKSSEEVFSPSKLEDFKGLRSQLIASGMYYELNEKNLISSFRSSGGYLEPEAHFICIYGF